MQPLLRKKHGSTKSNVVVAALLGVMITIWYLMHSMLRTHAAPDLPAASPAHAHAPALRAAFFSSSSYGSSSSSSSSSGHNTAHVLGPPTPEGPASLTPLDVSRLAAVLGPAAPNFTRSHFITIPSWVTAPNAADAHPPPPCLYAAKTKCNVYLFEDGWRDAAPANDATAFGGAGGSAQCPLPEGGQKPLPSADAAPEVSVTLAFRNMATATIRAILSVVHNARDVASVEIILLDIASRCRPTNEIQDTTLKA